MSPSVSSPALIRSKLYPPRQAAHHIPRDRLVDQLAASTRGALTLMCAPAGSGKSTLLGDWLAVHVGLHGWVSLDPRDNDLDVLLGYVLEAARHALPATAQQTRQLLGAPLLPPVDAFARSLSNDFDELEDDFLLVLDDYHVIENQHIHELLLQVLQHPPARLHLAIASRADPPWPLASLRARGLMAELDYGDLRFTKAETVQFLQKAFVGTLPGETIAVLHDESEGWAAGLQLMTLVLQGQHLDDLQRSRLPFAHEDIGEYLLAEVFSKQSAGDQDRLVRLSILPRFSATLCEAVARSDPATDAGAAPWGKDFISRLERANLFVVPLDAHHEFYRFHHLFQQFLSAQLVDRHPASEIAGLHSRASAWFAEHGLVEEALDHALMAGETATAARIVARHRHALYNQEQFARLTRWLRKLPEDVREQTPEILLAEARVATMNWRYTEAAVFLARAEQGLAERDPALPDADALRGELLVIRGILEYWDEDVDRFLAGARYALRVLPAGASHLRGLVHTRMASALHMQGDLVGARAYLAGQVANTSPRLADYAWLLQTQAFLNWIDGSLTPLHDVSRRLLQVSTDLDLPDKIAMAHYFLGIVHYARNELAAAKEHLDHAVSARYAMRLLWWSQAAGVQGLTHQALGQPAQAQAAIADAHTFVLEQHAVRILPNIGALQAELNRLQLRFAEANTWAAGVEPLPLPWSTAVVDPRVVQARIFLTQNLPARREHATRLLVEMRTHCKQIPNRRLLMEIDTLEVLLQAQAGQRDLALETLARVVNTAENDGWVRLFVDLGEELRQLLLQLASRDISPHYIQRILNAFPSDPGPVNPVQTGTQAYLTEPISERELEVLTLLAQRYSNKEIARRLYIAPATVKSHTINIYRKLNANDRREAVALANELGLVPTNA